MILNTVSLKLKRGLNRLYVRRDSSLLCVEAIPGTDEIEAFFACPVGRGDAELVRLVVEDNGTTVEYDADVEYVNSFWWQHRMYHAFILRERPEQE